MNNLLRDQLNNETGRENTISRIKILAKEVWENRVDVPDIDRWLENFTGLSMETRKEQLNALHLLAHFNYFGLKEIRELLKALYRDLYRYPIIQTIRQQNHGTRDKDLLTRLFLAECENTRFLGMGNPAESGSHLLYYFRQENKLSIDSFIHQHEILAITEKGTKVQLAIPGLKRLVFIDDLLGSGQQAIQYSQHMLQPIRDVAEREGVDLEICYFTLFANPEGLRAVRESGQFDKVHAVHELDRSERAFEPNSRVYMRTVDGVSLEDGVHLASTYGSKLVASPHSLGYRNSQLLLGLHHNIPDNTLPIFWYDEPGKTWNSIFPRHPKA